MGDLGEKLLAVHWIRLQPLDNAHVTIGHALIPNALSMVLPFAIASAVSDFVPSDLARPAG